MRVPQNQPRSAAGSPGGYRWRGHFPCSPRNGTKSQRAVQTDAAADQLVQFELAGLVEPEHPVEVDVSPLIRSRHAPPFPNLAARPWLTRLELPNWHLDTPGDGVLHGRLFFFGSV